MNVKNQYRYYFNGPKVKPGKQKLAILHVTKSFTRSLTNVAHLSRMGMLLGL